MNQSPTLTEGDVDHQLQLLKQSLDKAQELALQLGQQNLFWRQQFNTLSWEHQRLQQDYAFLQQEHAKAQATIQALTGERA